MSSTVFYVDQTLGQEFPDLLEAVGVPLVRFSEVFAPEVPDVEQVERVSKEGWYWVSKGGKIYTNPVQLYAMLSHGIGYFALTSEGTHAELADWFIQTIPTIGHVIGRCTRPFVASVTKPSLLRSKGRVDVRRTQKHLPPHF